MLIFSDFKAHWNAFIEAYRTSDYGRKFQARGGMNTVILEDHPIVLMHLGEVLFFYQFHLQKHIY